MPQAAEAWLLFDDGDAVAAVDVLLVLVFVFAVVEIGVIVGC